MQEYTELNNQQKFLLDNILNNLYDNFIEYSYTYSSNIEMSNDGNMGSFKFIYPANNKKDNQTYAIGEVSFNDTDGVLCIATLYTYDDNRLDGLDIWKVDFSPLIQYPKSKKEISKKLQMIKE